MLNADLQLLTRAEARKAAEGRTRSCEAAGAAGQSRSLVTNPSCSPPVLAGRKQTGTAACSGVPSWEQCCCFRYPACRSISCQLSQLKKTPPFFLPAGRLPGSLQQNTRASQQLAKWLCKHSYTVCTRTFINLSGFASLL